MKRWRPASFVLLLTGAITFPGPSVASDARVEGLGIDGIYVDDYEGYRLFPTVFARAGNLVAASLGTSGTNERDNSFGVIGSGARGKYGAFGIFLRGRSPFLDDLSAFDDGLDGPDATITSQQYDLGWAKQFDRLAIGVRFEQARSRAEIGDDVVTPAAPAGTWNTTAVHAGVKIDTRKTDFIEVGAEFRSLSFRNTLEDPDVEDDADLSMRLSARYWAALNDRVDFVPAFNYSKIDLTREGDEDDRTFTRLHAGGAFIFDVNQDNMLTLGAALNRQENNADDVTVTLMPTLFGALEWDIKSWLTGRVGAQQSMSLLEDGDDDELLDSDFQYGLGVGLHFNNFDLDATLNQDFPFTGGYFLSGQETSGGPLFGRITGVYFF
jgi:hypothetical protein